MGNGTGRQKVCSYPQACMHSHGWQAGCPLIASRMLAELYDKGEHELMEEPELDEVDGGKDVQPMGPKIMQTRPMM